MVEQRITYMACSGNEPRYTAEDTRPLCEQIQQNVIHSSDIVLLVPMFQSMQADADDPCAPCLHLVRLPDARLGLCNVLTEQRCTCCHCPICAQHQSGQYMQHEECTALLCTTCALLPIETRYALYTFWRVANQQSDCEEEVGYVDQ